MIKGASNVSEIFSAFHDGVITGYKSDTGDLHLDVRITYLSQRIHSDYRSFRVTLCAVQDMSFTTWPKEAGAAPAILLENADIFEPSLQILGGAHEGDVIKVSCNQQSAASAHCGGELLFSAKRAVVTDEGGREYPIGALRQLCKVYWDEWNSRANSR